MKKIQIYLSQPFEEILATVLSLPRAHGPASNETSDEDRELKQVLRGLYEAANGRQVETPLGLVPIAPPVAPFLKAAPFEVATQLDFLVEAMARVITCSSELTALVDEPGMNGSHNGQVAPIRANVAVEERKFLRRLTTTSQRPHLQPQGISHG